MPSVTPWGPLASPQPCIHSLNSRFPGEPGTRNRGAKGDGSCDPTALSDTPPSSGQPPPSPLQTSPFLPTFWRPRSRPGTPRTSHVHLLWETSAQLCPRTRLPSGSNLPRCWSVRLPAHTCPRVHRLACTCAHTCTCTHTCVAPHVHTLTCTLTRILQHSERLRCRPGSPSRLWLQQAPRPGPAPQGHTGLRSIHAQGPVSTGPYGVCAHCGGWIISLSLVGMEKEGKMGFEGNHLK